MAEDVLNDARTLMARAAARLANGDDPEGAALELLRLSMLLGRGASRLPASAERGEDPSTGPEARLHRRSLRDYAKLQEQLGAAATLLFDKGLFIGTLQRKGAELDSLNRSLAFTAALDRALQHLIDLMQYDTAERYELDIRNGFQFTSGSTSYQRLYFSPPKNKK